MLNRQIVALVFTLTVVLGIMVWKWERAPGLNFPVESQIQNPERLTQTLTGDWIGFSSLRQAWVYSDRILVEGTTDKSLIDGKNLRIPSTEKLKVVARKIVIPSEWSARNIRLVLEGLSGRANIYLNGIESNNRLGEIEGVGSSNSIQIPASTLKYGEENILLVELETGIVQKNKLLASFGNDYGKIIGDIHLEALAETYIDNPSISVNWDKDKALVAVSLDILHDKVEYGPWQLEGVIRDSGQGVASNSIVIKEAQSSSHQVTLSFVVPDAKKWSLSEPYLYQLEVKVSNVKGDKDLLVIPIALRTIVYDKGIFNLNNNQLKINGVVLDSELGDKVRNKGEIESWLREQKEQGFNLIYFSNRFPNKNWLEAADQIGIGIWAEWPVSLIPSEQLPDPKLFHNLIKEGSLHPSLWSWSIGKGLDLSDNKIKNYLASAENLLPLIPKFLLDIGNPSKAIIPSTRIIKLNEGSISGTWGNIIPLATTRDNKMNSSLQVASKIYAFWMIVLFVLNLRTVSWRYKELKEKKPKRSLRNAWFWQSIFFLSRMGTLSGIITMIFTRMPNSHDFWLIEVWPWLEELQLQSPWLIWIALTFIISLFRLLQVGVVAPYFPDSPNPLGLVYWFERRYRWAPIVAISWALEPYGLSLFISLCAYFTFSFVSLPFRVKDVHRIGASYKPLFLVPAIFVFLIGVWAAFNFEDWILLKYLIGDLAILEGLFLFN